jgi:sodium/hydrogen antiporter
MTAHLWFLLIGVLLIFMALAGTVLRRLPVSTAMLYVVIGMALGPMGAGALHIDLFASAKLLEHVSEAAVLISLFSAGLKLRAPLNGPQWREPLRLAVISMVVTIALIAAAACFVLGLPPGAAILLGAILAPTDPVLASDVQVTDAGDRDRVRFGLTGEAGLNDGIAFPFVMLGLGLLGLHELGDYGWRWVAVDVVWAVSAGLATGWMMGMAVGRLVLYFRAVHKEAVGLDEFLALGLIAVSYGTALLISAYGFLAVFAAGLALRRIEHRSSGDRPPQSVVEAAAHGRETEVATSPQHAPAYLARAVLAFNEQIERVTEVGVVLIIGALLSLGYLSVGALLIAVLLFLGIRPLSVAVGMAGAGAPPLRKWLFAWFGIRGIGSFYYLTFAITHGLPEALADYLIAIVLSVVAASIVIHGVSASPLMELYARRRRR